MKSASTISEHCNDLFLALSCGMKPISNKMHAKSYHLLISSLVPADKTSTFYRMDTTSYNSLLQITITKTYKKREAFKLSKTTSLTLPATTLMSPYQPKTVIGKISKQLLHRINAKLAINLELNQWKNTKAVLSWFITFSTRICTRSLHSTQCSFTHRFQWDVQFASDYDAITGNERHIILETKSSVLYSLVSHGERNPNSNSVRTIASTISGHCNDLFFWLFI